MNKNAFFDLSLSDSSSSEEGENSVEATLFETLFNEVVLARQMNQFDPEARRLDRLVVALATDIHDQRALERHLNGINRYLHENIEQTLQGVLLAKMLINCKHYVATRLSDEIDEDELQFAMTKTLSINQIMSRIAPKLELLHHNTNEPGIVRIEYDGQVIAFFKAGILRQQNDQFLHEFYSQIQKQVQFDDAVSDLFPTSTPIAIAVAQIHSNHNEPLFFSTTEREQNLFYEHSVSTDASEYSDWACIHGGIQAALSPWNHEQQSLSSLLIMLSMVLILGGRDVRENGIMAGGTIIDFEDFLEVKTNFPDIHIPFIAGHSHLKPEVGHWHMLAEYLKQLDLSQIVTFMEQYPYKSGSTVDSVLSLCQGERRDKLRTEYVYRRPSFSPDKLLSREQVTLCQKNIKKLRSIVDKICQQKKVDTTLFKLIASFDPRWEQQVFQLDAMRHSIEDGSENNFYDAKTIKQYSKSVGANRRSPELLAGNIARTPSPTMNQAELFELFVSSTGTILEKANIDNLARSLDAIDLLGETTGLKVFTK